MKREFSVGILLCAELYRALTFHGLLSLLNPWNSQKISHRQEFHQCNYTKIPCWRKLCDRKECFPVSSPKFLCRERAGGPAWQTSPEGSMPSPRCLTFFQLWPLLPRQICCYDSEKGKSQLRPRSWNRSVSQQDCVTHVHSQTAKTNLGHRNLVSLQLQRHYIPQMW